MERLVWWAFFTTVWVFCFCFLALLSRKTIFGFSRSFRSWPSISSAL